jgi:alcohol dehydrogenase class IV
MTFEFATANRIIFGRGESKRLPRLALPFGRRLLIITGSSTARFEFARDLLRDEGFSIDLFPVSVEPTVELIEQGATLARAAAVDLIIGFGGGSVIDSAKAIAALSTNPGNILDYLEVIGSGHHLKQTPLPCLAIPTTAGTGAEVTRNAVLASTRHKVKVSLRHPSMLPAVAIIDPELTWSMPPALTASTGLDALTQVIEPFLSNNANPMTDGFCREGIRRAGRSLRKAYADGGNIEAREDMAIASLMGGLALANAKLGAVHGFAAPIGGMFSAPHGTVCAALLPHVLQMNHKALEREGAEAGLARYHEIACLLTGKDSARPQEGIDYVRQLCEDLNIPGLREYGIVKTDFGEIVEKAKDASSMKGNPVNLSDEELSQILSMAL